MDDRSAHLVRLYSSRQDPIAHALRTMLNWPDWQLPGEMRQLLARLDQPGRTTERS